MRTYNPSRDVDESFLSTVHKWILEQGEVFVVLRYLMAAGAKDYAFAKTFDSFTDLLTILPEGTDIVVFKNRQLPLRGIVTDSFISQAQDSIPAGDEYMLVNMKPRNEHDCRLWGDMGDTLEDMLGNLTDHIGQVVSVGACPQFCEGDNENMISRAIGGVDGPR